MAKWVDAKDGLPAYGRGILGEDAYGLPHKLVLTASGWRNKLSGGLEKVVIVRWKYRRERKNEGLV